MLPFPAALGVPAGMCREGETQCVRQGRGPALPQLAGLLLAHLHKFCWQVGLNRFNSPVISKKENCLLTGVELDDLMDYLFLSVSHFDGPVSNEPSSLLKHSRVVEPSQCEWKVLCRLIS